MKKILILALCMILLASTPAFASEGMTKGLLLHSYDTLTDAQELGCQELLCNITSDQWKTNRSGTIWLMDQIASRGFKLTVVILKSTSAVTGANYAMMDDTDLAYVADVAAALGTRVGRYVIGNEINSQEWNYAGNMDTITYCQKYADIFAKCYNTIKGVNPAAEIYIPFNYGWYNESNNSNQYSGREVIQRLAGFLPKEMDWGVAWHPYPDPLNDPNFTDDAIATDNTYSNIVNFKNLHVLTDYLQTPELLKPDGSVRNVILSEEGFTSLVNGVVNEAAQAEYFRQSWAIAKANPYVKAYLLSRQVDASSEVANGWAFGLWNSVRDQNGVDLPKSKKAIWEVFRDIDKAAVPQLVGPGE